MADPFAQYIAPEPAAAAPDPFAQYIAPEAPAAAAPAPEKPGLLSRFADRVSGTVRGIGNTIVGGAKAAGEVLSDLPNAPGNFLTAAKNVPGNFVSAVKSPANFLRGDYSATSMMEPAERRRQLERGVDDMVTLGHGQKLADLIGRKIADTSAGRALGETPGNQLGATAASDQAAAPEFRQLGNVVGMAMPGATSHIAKEGGGFVSGLTSGLAAPTTALGRAAMAGGKSLAGYEATAPVLAGLSAGAEGHRIEAASDAATDPVGIGMSAISGLTNGKSEGLSPDVKRRLGLAPDDIRSSIVEGAKVRATKDIARDIVSAEGHKAKATDQARIRDTSDRLFQMTQENPELRKVWRESARKALPDIAEAKRQAAKPLDGKYAAVDQLTGGGVKLGDILDGFDSAAADAAKTASGQPQAARIRAVRDNFIQAYGKPGFDPTVDVGGVPAGEVVRRLSLAKGTEAQIAQVKDLAAAGIDREMRIPTAQFREEVTNLHKTADAALGQIEGTAKHEALSNLYDIGKGIIDKHLDESGLPATDLKALRKANNDYFLLSRAEAAIESRGIKEENRSGFRMPTTAHGALNATLPVAGMYAASNPHAIPHMVAAYALGHALPAIRSRLDWQIANMRPTARAAASSAIPLAPRAVQLGQQPSADGAALAAALSAAARQRNGQAP